MMITHRIKAIFSLLAFVLLMFSSATAQEYSVVVPNGYESSEGPDGTDGTGGYLNGYRLQGVYSASAFASLPDSHHIMTGFSFRPDGALTHSHTVTWPDFTLKLSTTTATPSNLSMNFQWNIGQDETVVYDGPITLATANIGQIGGPKEFNYAFLFQTPFHYDPAMGNLLMDWINVGIIGCHDPG